MGLETGVTRIEDLNTAWPLPTDDVLEGDDHLRNVKLAVQGSFPSLGPDQVTATALELNDVTNKLVSFNGRTDVAAVPVDDDYSATGEGDGAGIAKLADFDTGWTDGDYPVWDGDKFVPTSTVVEEYRAYGATRPTTNGYTLTFDTVEENTISNLGTVLNAADTGWAFIAAVGKTVEVSIAISHATTSDNAFYMAFVSAPSNLILRNYLQMWILSNSLVISLCLEKVRELWKSIFWSVTTGMN